MSRRLSMNARLHQDDAISDDAEVILMEIEHALLDQPVLLSTDPSMRFSDDPLVYGTRSNWRGSGTARDFQFVGASVELPGEIEGAGIDARLSIGLVLPELVEALRRFAQPPAMEMAVVSINDPHDPQMRVTGLQIIEASASSSGMEFVLASKPIEQEQFPAPRMTQNRFPAVFR